MGEAKSAWTGVQQLTSSPSELAWQAARNRSGGDHEDMTGPVLPLPPDMRSGPILVGVDNAAACGRPLRAAVFLARAAGRPVVLVHVRAQPMPMVEGYLPITDDISLIEDGRSDAQLRRDLEAGGDLTGVDWELVAVNGDAASELLRLADDRDAACVVVGKRHRGFADVLHRIASGSVSRTMVGAQRFPVLVVP